MNELAWAWMGVNVVVVVLVYKCGGSDQCGGGDQHQGWWIVDVECWFGVVMGGGPMHSRGHGSARKMSNVQRL